MATENPQRMKTKTLVTELASDELPLIDGIGLALEKQGMSVRQRNGVSFRRYAIVREAIRVAAQTLGLEVGDKKLVALAESLKVRFRMPVETKPQVRNISPIRKRPIDSSRSAIIRTDANGKVIR